ncbi:MAG: hypothetical protein AB1671_23475 [Thermodesulfobacteriota bacterium]
MRFLPAISRPLLLSCLFALGVTDSPVLWAQAVLENPQPGSFQSGIGVVSGWACEAERVEVEVNGVRLRAAYGTTRGDTRDSCGDEDNGFGLTFNWNLLGDGLHTVRAFTDGVEFATVTFTVTTLGTEFLRGVLAQYTLSGFPQAGTSTIVRWQESLQNFVIASVNSDQGGGHTAGNRAVLENPQPGSFQSGIGVVSGWACEAERVEVEVNGVRLRAAYGTTRGDTRDSCGDEDNGFGLTFNWNLLGDGLHTVRAFTDGVEFATVTFTVTTLGTEFLRGASGEFTLLDFPEVGTNVIVRWQESAQNFVIARAERYTTAPRVAGDWDVELQFLSNDCPFLTVPGDLPTRLSTTLKIDQQQTRITGIAGENSYSGTVNARGDLSLSRDVADLVEGPSCSLGVSDGFAGNFLTGQLAFSIVVVELAGDCDGVPAACAAEYVGTIRRAGVTASHRGTGDVAGAAKGAAE